MSDDAIECRIRYWFCFRRKTHDIKVGDKVIGQLYDDGSMTFDDPGPDDDPRTAAAQPVPEAA